MNDRDKVDTQVNCVNNLCGEQLSKTNDPVPFGDSECIQHCKMNAN